jgi:hypothetical protein
LFGISDPELADVDGKSKYGTNMNVLFFVFRQSKEQN